MANDRVKIEANKSALLVVLTIVFVDLLGFGMIIPLIALYGKHFGANMFQLAILGCIYSLMQFIFAPFWGSLSDKYGRRPILMVSLLGSTISYLIFALAPNFTCLLLSRGFAGLFTANLSTAHAFVSDCTEESERAKYMGFVGAALGLGFTLGPPFGGIVALHYSLAMPGFIASAICGLNLLAAYFYLPESLAPSERRPVQARFFKLDFDATRRALALPSLKVFLIAGFITTLAFSHLEQAFSLFLQVRLSLSIEESAYRAGILMLAMGVIGVIVQGGLIRSLSATFGEKKLLLAGVLLSALALPFFASSNSYLMFIFASVPLAVGSALIGPSVASLVSKSAPQDRLGETFGVNQGLSSLARVIGPFSGLTAFSLWSPLPFLIGAILYAALFAYLGIILQLFAASPIDQKLQA